MDNNVQKKFQKALTAQCELCCAICKLGKTEYCDCEEPQPYDFGAFKGKGDPFRFLCLECGGVVHNPEEDVK